MKPNPWNIVRWIKLAVIFTLSSQSGISENTQFVRLPLFIWFAPQNTAVRHLSFPPRVWCQRKTAAVWIWSAGVHTDHLNVLKESVILRAYQKYKTNTTDKGCTEAKKVRRQHQYQPEEQQKLHFEKQRNTRESKIKQIINSSWKVVESCALLK